MQMWLRSLSRRESSKGWLFGVFLPEISIVCTPLCSGARFFLYVLALMAVFFLVEYQVVTSISSPLISPMFVHLATNASLSLMLVLRYGPTPENCIIGIYPDPSNGLAQTASTDDVSSPDRLMPTQSEYYSETRLPVLVAASYVVSVSQLAQ